MRLSIMINEKTEIGKRINSFKQIINRESKAHHKLCRAKSFNLKLYIHEKCIVHCCISPLVKQNISK